MKHSNYYQQIQSIKEQEYKELYAVVELYGGIYSWNPDNGEEAPIIAVNPDCITPNPVDVIIYRVETVGRGLKIYGQDKNDGSEVDFEPEDIFAGGISAIIDYMTEINGIDNETLRELKEAI